MKVESEINRTWKRLKNKERICMYKNCNRKAINSQVYQKNGILKQISENNHLMQLQITDAYKIKESGIMELKRIGINDAYSFKGFCNDHDTKIFSAIETRDNLDFFETNTQALFSYRGLCQEIRRKEISLEFVNKMMLLMNHPQAIPLSNGFKSGIKNLTFFKNELETAILNQTYTNFNFSTFEIPKIKLCISVPLNIEDLENPNNLP